MNFPINKYSVSSPKSRRPVAPGTCSQFVAIPCCFMAYEEKHLPAFERRYWPCRRLGNICLTPSCQRCLPRPPLPDRLIPAPRYRIQLPPGAVLMTLVAKQVSNRHPYGLGPPVPVVWGVESGADFGMFRSTGERGGESIGVGDASCEGGTYMPPVVWLQAVYAAELFRDVELGRILKVSDPAHVGFFC